MPIKKGGWTNILGQPVDVGDAADQDYDGHHWRFGETREETSRDGERRECMSDDVHG
jgi:hypothetical protein